MGEDEAGTLTRLRDCRQQVINPIVAQFHGRVIKLMGDGALLEFSSVVDAVECAAAIQRAMAVHDPKTASTRRIQLRIGINLGDIIVEGDDIYGDGVNIAARLESLADPGGICVSGTAFDHATHKVGVGFESLGDVRLKNIAEPVRAYRIVLDPAAAGRIVAKPRRSLLKPATAGVIGLAVAAAIAAVIFWRGPVISARPSLAVLPFANLSGDPKEAYFADGITEDLITDLAKLSALDVIARNSVFKYRDRPIVLKDVARELGIGYVLEGSVRRDGDQIRINAQLVDATTGDHLWADKYDRNSSDVFAVEDEIVDRVVAALGVKPTAAEANQLTRPPTANLEAYDYYLRGEHAARSGFRPQLSRALDFFEKAEALDPAFADAFAADARTSVFVWRMVYDDVLPSPVAKKRAYEMASRALSLNPRSSQPYAVLADLQAVDGQYDQALTSARRAVALGPNDIDAHIALGLVLMVAGQHAEAVTAIETAQRLDPNLAATDRQVAGLALLLSGNYERAVETLEQARADAPGVDEIRILLAAAFAAAGRIDEARAEVAETLRLFPSVSVEQYRLSYSFFRDVRDLEPFLAALAKAGFPRWPYGVEGDERDRLTGEDVSHLVLGHTLRGKVNLGAPALMQIGKDGQMVFRSTTQLLTGKIVVDDDMMCQQSDNAALGRMDCGSVYRRAPATEEPRYMYVNATYVFYFSPVD